ncbi:tubulin-like doman-containing protein [Haloplanus aerogenes]|uniref:Tubulin-like protein n=1 Tax=Haloplanus aerogenes TaxID=660522 RepID=A0A3M0DVZ2_9EURY|nr:tubulin-like doman-containing protein [Haloplanus aerogenes]AZH24657.1 hypothetical protein DU502_04325 [Haloplanus aerogenes]RMB23686.1 tubulin-like protein [Haloplanus aerogenes]
MPGVPTFVVGAGAAGVDVVCRLAARGERRGATHLGYLAVDSDPETLDRAADAVPTLHLASDSGVVGDGRDAYPYLATDVTIPDAGANRLRHVGRYKLDNAVSPDFLTHYNDIRDRVTAFYDDRQASLDARLGRYNLVVVSSLAGGTGSGVFPLLTALLTHVATHSLADADVRLLGVGIVPPLHIDPTYSAPPVEPVAYPNTYGALRNLATLLDGSVRIPTYAMSDSLVETTDDDSERPISFELDDAPFDSYWLVGTDHADDSHSPETVAEMVADALYATTAYVSPTHRASRPAPISPLGTIGYAAVAVPHRSLRRFCERKRDRARAKSRLEEMVAPKIEERRNTRDDLSSILNDVADESASARIERLERVRDRLDGRTDLDAGFVTENEPREIGEVLETIATDEDLESCLAAARAVEWALADGPVGTDLRQDLERTWTEIHDSYEFPVVADGVGDAAPLARRLDALHRGLTDRLDYFQGDYTETDPSVRDIFPPTHDLFTSERERLAQLIDRLDADVDRVSTAIDRLDTLRAAESLVDEYVQAAREEIHSRLDDVKAELALFRRERDDLTDRIRELDREVADLRDSLTQPSDDGPVFWLPLDWEALDGLTLDDVDRHLTSLDDYADRDLLAVDDRGIERILQRGYDYSRAWPDGIARHDVSVSSAASHDDVVVLSHRANTARTAAFVESLTGPDTLYTAGDGSYTHTDDPYRIEFVSRSHGGTSDSLAGFQRLAEMAQDGTLDAMAGPYRDFRRALAYPEWYDESVRESF